MPALGPASPLVVDAVDFGWTSERPILHGCSLGIARPGLWMLVGSNGSGKSTLLRLIAGLLTPNAGRIHSPLRPALVFQNPDHQLLMPTAGTDLRLGLPLALSHRQAMERMEDLLEQVGLQGIGNRPIHTLSGGQKQRLAIAGALAAEANLLLLDEPTALLDPDSQAEVLALIRALCDRSPDPLTALWVTHRLEELPMADGAARMERGTVGPWEIGAEVARALSPLPIGGGGG
ncbi:MAG: ABC transporter ATP-binding protein [Cyanobacteriota bacterium]|nr:ABC transporter ATP-binding protein [Cyanobacteriota bacterium]